jgi:DNA-binding NarL/FixJ family response regulator
MSAPSKISLEELQEMIQLYRDKNMTVPFLSAKYSISENSIRDRLKKAGVLRAKNEKLIPHYEAIVKMRKEGKTLKEIASFFNCSDVGILKILKKLNVQ